MLLIPYAVLAVCCACVQQLPTQPPEKDIIHVDGRRNPELIPDYVLWEHGFGGLAIIKERNMQAAIESLRLAPSDLALVWQEAARQKMREEESASRQRRRRESSKTADVKPEQLLLELRKIILDYRWSVLQARDRLLAAMTPEGQAVLLTWMEAGRVNIEAFVPKSDWEFFRQPR